jgi:hypothetical protein
MISDTLTCDSVFILHCMLIYAILCCSISGCIKCIIYLYSVKKILKESRGIVGASDEDHDADQGGAAGFVTSVAHKSQDAEDDSEQEAETEVNTINI